MARIAVGPLVREIDLVAFDKDGTLIDFYHLWGRRARAAVAAVTERADAAVEGGAALAAALYRSIGYDPERDRAAADGPLAIASMPKLYTICATVLYQHGLSWHAAEDIAQDAFAGALGAIPTADQVRPLGDVAGLFGRLAAAGVKIAIVTSDDREATQATLRLLGLADHVAAMVCGNDPIPNKPAPDAIHHLTALLGVPTTRMMIVGDTIGDLQTGRNAGIGCCIGVLSGTGREPDLAVHADAVVGTIDEIRVSA